jgi:SAM-dependent methyltransferase
MWRHTCERLGNKQRMMPGSAPQGSPEESSPPGGPRSDEGCGVVCEAYERREHSVSPDTYSRRKPDSLLRIQELERGILQLPRTEGISELSQEGILEVGCGNGAWLWFLRGAGASPEAVCAVDLLPPRIEEARRKCAKGTTLRREDASQLSFETESFDFLLARTACCSILVDHLRGLLAREMLRVLGRGGRLLWYDVHGNNPRNPDVRRVTRDESKDLFPHRSVTLPRITLAPPLSQAVASTVMLYWLLSNVQVLCSHPLGWITRE